MRNTACLTAVALLHTLGSSATIMGAPPAASFNKDLGLLRAFLGRGRIHCITGAGVSTGSNIPDYRSPNGSYSRGHKPITHQDFIKYESSRKRYWLRSIVGWDSFRLAQPNQGHYALARLESSGLVSGLITQNVDRLHSKAGSLDVLEIHGRNDFCGCLNSACGYRMPRNAVQVQLALLNKALISRVHDPALAHTSRRADGDTNIETDAAILDEVKIVACPKCGAPIKPTVVFFGDNVLPETRLACNAAVDACDGLLVVGTSLEVYSVYQYILQCNDRGVPVAIINRGQTRAEREGRAVALKADQDCSTLLHALADELI